MFLMYIYKYLWKKDSTYLQFMTKLELEVLGGWFPSMMIPMNSYNGTVSATVNCN